MMLLFYNYYSLFWLHRRRAEGIRDENTFQVDLQDFELEFEEPKILFG